jgi:uncharacterized membrane protein YhfC
MILYFTHLLNSVLMIALPIGLGIYLTRKYALGWRLWWIGAGTFVLSQVGHIPFNVVLTLLFNRGLLPAPAPEHHILFNATVLGLSAGLWEETFRYGAYRWWAKDARSWSKALLMGNGHGGIEAILLGLIVLINYLFMLAAQGADITALVPESQLGLLQEQIALYWSIPWYDSLLGALERVFALPLQIALSVLVLQAFVRKKIFWFFIALGWHAIVDALAVYLVGTQSVYVVEATIGVLALVSVGAIFALRLPAPPQEIETTTSPQPTPPLTLEINPEDLDPDRLDETMFQ